MTSHHDTSRTSIACIAFSLLPVPPIHLHLFHPNQSPQVLRSPSDTFKHLSREQYLAQLAQLQTIAEACKVNATACGPGPTTDDVLVEASPGTPAFEAGRDWLRTALSDAKSDKASERADRMTKVSARLQGDASELCSTADPVPAISAARAKANNILNRTEFRTVQQNSWFSQKVAVILGLLSAFLARAFSHVPHAPWFALAIEWSILACAAVRLLIWAWRTTRQQRLSLAAPTAESTAAWQNESDDWAKRAEVEAARGDWREAVHCLYWAAIVMLEGKKLWRANRARTLREYLPLLEAGSARQLALSGLTRIFECIWYGLSPAGRYDFERAQALLDELKAT